MPIYLDVLFFINGVMDFLMLTLTSAIFGFYGKVKYRIVASLLGSLLACIFFMWKPVADWFLTAIALFLISSVMVWIAYEYTGFRGFLKRLFCLFLVTYGFGGAVYWFLERTGGGFYLFLLFKTPEMRHLYLKSFLLISGGVFLVLMVLGGTGQKVKEEQQLIYPVTLGFRRKPVHTMGLLDTGNRLREPDSKKAVLVGEFDILRKGLEPEIEQWLDSYFKEGKTDQKPKQIYWIPFTSVGKTRGRMPAVLCPFVMTAKAGEVEKKDVLVALTSQSLSPSQEYFLLLHTDLWKE